MITRPPSSISVEIQRAVTVIKANGVIAYPTEAVWGLGCDPFSKKAVERILVMKQRKLNMGLILIARNIEQLDPFLIGLSLSDIDELQKSWPGPQTWLVPNNNTAPDWITGKKSTLAVRVTDHPIASALCANFGAPLVSTSANPHGLPPAKTISKINKYFAAKIDYIVPGMLGKIPNPTPIKHLSTGEILRPG